jgi:uncharacterized protein YdaU (DUF1376 family)
MSDNAMLDNFFQSWKEELHNKKIKKEHEDRKYKAYQEQEAVLCATYRAYLDAHENFKSVIQKFRGISTCEANITIAKSAKRAAYIKSKIQKICKQDNKN